MSAELTRRLGLFDTTAVVVGAIIGVGIFFTPAEVARLAGSTERALTVWLLGGLVALLGALTFAELGRRFPRAGGQYDVLRAAWGPTTAFVYTFCVQTAVLPGSAALIAVIAAFNLALAVTGAPPAPGYGTGVALVLVLGVAAANAGAVRNGTRIQNVTVISKLLTLLAITALALVYGGPAVGSESAEAAALTRVATAPSSLFVAMLPAMFSYGGWQQGLWMGGEVKDPERTLPRALVTGVVIVVLVYLAAAWAYFELLGFEGVTGAGALAAEAVGRVYPGVGERVVAGAVAISAFGVLNAQFLTGPRLTYAVSADGRFFPIFARIDPRTGTPLAAVVLLCGLTIAVLTLGTDTMGGLTAWIVVLDALFFGLTGLALLRLGARGPKWWICAGGFAALELACVAFSLFDDAVQASALAGAVWVALALVAARFWTPRTRAQ